MTMVSWYHGLIHHFTGEKCLRMRRDKNHVVDFRQSHWLRGKIPRNVVKMKEEMAAFFVCGSVVFSAINWHDLTAIRSAHTVNRNFEFLCVVQIQRSIAVHNRKLKSRGINLIYLTPSCRKVVAYRFGRIFIDQNKYSDY